MNQLLNFDQASKELDKHLNNLLTDSKNNQHYEKEPNPIDYSKYTINQLFMQERKEQQFIYYAFGNMQ